MKYRDQKDAYSCAPIAVMNALRWMGFKNIDDDTHESLQSFWKVFNTKTDGTNIKSLIGGINRLEISDEFYTRPSLRKLDSKLKKRRAAIISYWGKDAKGNDSGHAILCVDKIGDHYKVINCVRTSPKPVQYVRPYAMKKFLRYIDPSGIKSKVWFIKRIHYG